MIKIYNLDEMTEREVEESIEDSYRNDNPQTKPKSPLRPTRFDPLSTTEVKQPQAGKDKTADTNLHLSEEEDEK